MDPAGPNFVDKGSNDRLSKNDASWVDNIHTNGGSGLPSLGIYEAIGHADFYPNGGRSQPGCLINKVTVMGGESIVKEKKPTCLNIFIRRVKACLRLVLYPHKVGLSYITENRQLQGD